MKKAGFIVSTTLIFLLSCFSCEIINPPEDIPAYIQIDTFKVVVDDFDKGTAGHMMGDIWLSVGGKNMGVYTMPFTIPTLETGFQTLTVKPGIKMNGISASRIAYPFFKPYIIDEQLTPGETTTIEPVSTYKEECVFPYIENFDDPGVSFIYPAYSQVAIDIQKDVVREGRSSGAIFLTKEDTLFEAYLDEDFDLPENATPVFLEFDYKNNNGFQVGFYLIEDGAMEWSGLVYVRPSATWKRIYVDLGTTATYQHHTDLYRISFIAAHEQEDENTTGEIYLDNIKVIHY